MVVKKFRHACKVFSRDFYWNGRGKWIRNPTLPGQPRKFLFVCKGNICRSPVAEQLAEHVLSPRGGPFSLEFASAGLEVVVPERSPKEAVQAAEMLGINLREHRAAGISAESIEKADMVLAMEVRQLHQLVRRFPAHRSRFFLLPLFGNPRAKGYGRYHIPDPYGKPVSEFSRCFREIRECLLNLKAALALLPSSEDLAGEEQKAGLQLEGSHWS